MVAAVGGIFRAVRGEGNQGAGSGSSTAGAPEKRIPVPVSAEVAEARDADGRTFRRARFLRPAGDSRDGYPRRCGSGEFVLSRGAAVAAAPEVVGGESEDKKSETDSEMFEAVGVMHCGIESVGHQSCGGENEEQRGP